jgi:hypothetical protein
MAGWFHRGICVDQELEDCVQEDWRRQSWYLLEVPDVELFK